MQAQSPLNRSEKSGQARKAVDGLDFELFQGKTLAIVGKSGPAKSLTALALLGRLLSQA